MPLSAFVSLDCIEVSYCIVHYSSSYNWAQIR